MGPPLYFLLNLIIAMGSECCALRKPKEQQARQSSISWNIVQMRLSETLQLRREKVEIEEVNAEVFEE